VPKSARAFAGVVAAEDVPASLPALRRELRELQNWGLRLRWEVALAEMEAYRRVPVAEAEAAIARWNDAVCDLLEDSRCFAPIPDQRMTNDSIVSFQVLVDDELLDHEQMVELYTSVVTGRHRGFSGDRDRVFFGQPVRYSHGSFIRLALGSHSVRAMVRGASTTDDDARLLEVIEDTARRLFG